MSELNCEKRVTLIWNCQIIGVSGTKNGFLVNVVDSVSAKLIENCDS